jgi:hypothetical protein
LGIEMTAVGINEDHGGAPRIDRQLRPQGGDHL